MRVRVFKLESHQQKHDNTRVKCVCWGIGQVFFSTVHGYCDFNRPGGSEDSKHGVRTACARRRHTRKNTREGHLEGPGQVSTLVGSAASRLVDCHHLTRFQTIVTVARTILTRAAPTTTTKRQ